MKANFKLLTASLAIGLALGACPALAQDKKSDSAFKDGTEFLCADYAPCATAAGLADNVARGQAMLDKISAFFSSLGRTPAKSREEFDAWVQSLPPSGRTELVDRCAKIRGEDERDYCESIYLSPTEQKAIRDEKRARASSMTRGEAQRARDAIYDRDSTLGSFIRTSCKGQNYEGCQRDVNALVLLENDADKLNRNPDYQKYFPAVVLNSSEACKDVGCGKDARGVWTPPQPKSAPPAQAAAPKEPAKDGQQTAASSQPPKELLKEPPALPGESYAVTKNGCGLFFQSRTDEKDTQKTREYFGSAEWEGECRNGLVNGQGAITGILRYSSNYASGRLISNSGNKEHVSFYTLGDRTAAISAIPNPYGPTWGDGIVTSSYLSIDDVSFRAEIFEGRYRIAKLDQGNPKANVSPATYYDCPDPHSPKGCEALWYEKTADIAAQIKAFIEEVKQKEPERIRQLAALNAQWDAQWQAQHSAQKPTTGGRQSTASSGGDQTEKAKKAGEAIRAQEAASTASTGNQGAPAHGYMELPLTDEQMKAVYPEFLKACGALLNSPRSTCMDGNAAGKCDFAAKFKYVVPYGDRQTFQRYIAEATERVKETEASNLQFKKQIANEDKLLICGLNFGLGLEDPRAGNKLLHPRPNQAATTVANTPAEKICQAELDRLAAQIDAKNKAIPESENVRRLEMIMWGSDAAAKAIERLCPQSVKYKPQHDQYVKTVADTKRTCDAIASRPCTPQAN